MHHNNYSWGNNVSELKIQFTRYVVYLLSSQAQGDDPVFIVYLHSTQSVAQWAGQLASYRQIFIKEIQIRIGNTILSNLMSCECVIMCMGESTTVCIDHL